MEGSEFQSSEPVGGGSEIDHLLRQNRDVLPDGSQEGAMGLKTLQNVSISVS